MSKTQIPTFSFYKAPVTNTTPYRAITLRDVFLVVSGDYYKERTQRLRGIPDTKHSRDYKATAFDFVCFSGTFRQRSESTLVKHSGYLVLDFDHLQDVKALKNQLLKDPCLETELLFVSPSGNGLKWVITIDVSGQYTHGQYFDAVSNYVRSVHGQEVDKSGRDVARVCFLCWDPEAYIHPKYLLK